MDKSPCPSRRVRQGWERRKRREAKCVGMRREGHEARGERVRSQAVRAARGCSEFPPPHCTVLPASPSARRTRVLSAVFRVSIMHEE